MYNVDIDGSSLLHLAVNSGVLGVRQCLNSILSNLQRLTLIKKILRKLQSSPSKPLHVEFQRFMIANISAGCPRVSTL